jgi:hypothetical protein
MKTQNVTEQASHASLGDSERQRASNRESTETQGVFERLEAPAQPPPFGWGAFTGGESALPPGESISNASAGAEPRSDCNKATPEGRSRRLHMTDTPEGRSRRLHTTDAALDPALCQPTT